MFVIHRVSLADEKDGSLSAYIRVGFYSRHSFEEVRKGKLFRSGS
jgi:hypothetical protein